MADEPASIVYQDRWLVIAVKPSGLPTQATRTGEAGLYEWLKDQHAYVGLHHRLDRPASGLVLFTLDPSANRGVAQALADRSLVREYQVVVDGRAQTARWSWPVSGKDAKTEFSVVGSAQGMTAGWCALHTGRRHQIRIHAGLAGHPVIGDRRYGAEAGRRWPRLALHAARLGLRHPISGADVVVESPLPEDLAPLWSRAGG
ncbi:MAG: 23S rRNA pseudouridine1911/1915/1917 synthase [Myxococcota bacterium]